MEEFLISISSSLGLGKVLSLVDIGVVASSAALLVITGFNFLLPFKDKKTSIPEIEQKPSEETEVKTDEEVEKPSVKPRAVEAQSWDSRLFKGLSQTRADIWGKIGSLLSGETLNQETIDQLEEILFASDLSPVLVDELIEHIKSVHKPEIKNTNEYLLEIKIFLKSKMVSAQDKINPELYRFEGEQKKLKVIMIIGVNGAGKTTTIGKFATKLKKQGASVVVGACDTFRAAAVEQLEVWCQRAGVEIVKAAEGADPSGVAFDTVKKAVEMKADYCIIDTAGRLHTKSNLMDELVKTKKVMSKVLAEAPHETLLVVDAITGQNALRQAEEFNKSLELTGLVFTKCDGSSKAGSAVGIVEKLQVPIAYIGVGEDVDDLDIFELDKFLDALLGIEA